jgi:hypothetical protein
MFQLTHFRSELFSIMPAHERKDDLSIFMRSKLNEKFTFNGQPFHTLGLRQDKTRHRNP